LRLSERRATNIGLLYPKVRNNIGGDIPVDVPPTKILGDVSPASPAGLTPVGKGRRRAREREGKGGEGRKKREGEWKGIAGPMSNWFVRACMRGQCR